MSKRFTDTAKWQDPWFRKLSPSLKCFWNYLCDSCDHAGVWVADIETASHFIGEEIDEAKALKAFGERIETLSGGKWRVVKFVLFQNPTLSKDCKPHAPIFAAIKRHGLDADKVAQGERMAVESLSKPIESLSVGIECLQVIDYTSKGIDVGLSLDQRAREEKPAEEIFAAYPRRVGKADALKAIGKAAKIGGGFARLLERTKAYAEATKHWPEKDRQFIPHPATWFNRGSYDDDPKTWERESSGGREPVYKLI